MRAFGKNAPSWHVCDGGARPERRRPALASAEPPTPAPRARARADCAPMAYWRLGVLTVSATTTTSYDHDLVRQRLSRPRRAAAARCQRGRRTLRTAPRCTGRLRRAHNPTIGASCPGASLTPGGCCLAAHLAVSGAGVLALLMHSRSVPRRGLGTGLVREARGPSPLARCAV